MARIALPFCCTRGYERKPDLTTGQMEIGKGRAWRCNLISQGPPSLCALQRESYSRFAWMRRAFRRTTDLWNWLVRWEHAPYGVSRATPLASWHVIVCGELFSVWWYIKGRDALPVAKSWRSEEKSKSLSKLIAAGGSRRIAREPWQYESEIRRERGDCLPSRLIWKRTQQHSSLNFVLGKCW